MFGIDVLQFLLETHKNMLYFDVSAYAKQLENLLAKKIEMMTTLKGKFCTNCDREKVSTKIHRLKFLFFFFAFFIKNDLKSVLIG